MIYSNQASGQYQAVLHRFVRHQGCNTMSCTRTRHHPRSRHLTALSDASEGDGLALEMDGPVLDTQDLATEAGQSTGYTSLPLIALKDLATRSQDTITENVRVRWVGALKELREEAVMLGIPRTALPKIPDSASLEEYRGIHKHLSGMIASFMSSSL